MLGLLTYCLLAAAITAQSPTATTRLSQFVRGGPELGWFELGNVLVKATLDEDVAAVARELVACLAADRPQQQRERALRVLLRWSELPTFADMPDDCKARIGKALLGVAEQATTPVELRGRALVAFGHLLTQNEQWIAKAEAQLRQRLRPTPKPDPDAEAMAPFLLQFLGATAPASLWTLPVVEQVARASAGGSDVWRAALLTLGNLGCKGADTDARTAFVACANLLPCSDARQFVLVAQTMMTLQHRREQLFVGTEAIAAGLSLLENARQIEAGQRVGAGTAVQAIGKRAVLALARSTDRDARLPLQQRLEQLLATLGDVSDPDLHAVAQAWQERPR